MINFYHFESIRSGSESGIVFQIGVEYNIQSDRVSWVFERIDYCTTYCLDPSILYQVNKLFLNASIKKLQCVLLYFSDSSIVHTVSSVLKLQQRPTSVASNTSNCEQFLTFPLKTQSFKMSSQVTIA